MTDHRIRSGSLQFWPRKRARKMLPSANWNNLKIRVKGKGLLGFIGYKVGMTSAYVKDNTPDSMTKTKKIAVPATIIECPELKIYSVRFYKNHKVLKDFIVGFDNELKRSVKKPKEIRKIDDFKGEFDDLRVIVYSNVKKTGIKKSPDMIELSLGGSKEEKLEFVKSKIGKEIHVSDVFSEGLVDIHGVTRGFGLQGPVKRFGITLKSHKSEKGQRRPGSLGPWHPARVTFRTPIAGQTGYQTRVAYNNLLLQVKKISENDINQKQGFHKYGNIKTSYVILKGSVPGAKKRPILLTPSFRPTKSRAKLKYEMVELR